MAARCLLGMLLWLSGHVALAQPVELRVDAASGLPEMLRGGVRGLSMDWAFWAAGWAWAGFDVRTRIDAPVDYGLQGTSEALGLDMSGRVRRSSAASLSMRLDFAAAAARADVVGGGLVVRFDLPAFAATMGQPELLPDNRGWSWGRAGGPRVELHFDRPLAAVYRERGQPDELRLMFFRGRINAGVTRFEATLSVSGGEVVQSLAERFGPAGTDGWAADRMGPQEAPFDLSFLNAADKPAGRRGFVRPQADRLVFDDGTQARFWGTNLTAYAIFGTSKDEARRTARRLSRLGYNLVRLHHHDSEWVEPNVFGPPGRPDTAALDEAALDRYDWWVKCLKDEGIYVWIDLHVGRAFRAGDGIEHFSEIAAGKSAAEAKGFNYVNAGIRAAMKRYNERFVGRINRYTGVRYADEPAIAGYLLTNENDVTHHFGNALLPDKGAAAHGALYLREAGAFADRWGLDREQTWRAWEAGPSKLFLNDLEHRFNEELVAQLRALGVRVAIATTSTWGRNPLASLPALAGPDAEGRIVDVHSYGAPDELRTSPFWGATSLHWIAAAQVANRPLSVTEWNREPFPADDRHVLPLMVAAMAGHQGWDALMHYAYAQSPPEATAGPSNWHSFNDPSMLATLPAAALMYRQQHVREAVTTYAFTPSKQTLLYTPVSPLGAPALRMAGERGKLVVVLPESRELPWLGRAQPPAGAVVFSDPGQSFLPAGASRVTSDTGQLQRDWSQGTYTVATARTQAAAGWIGGRVVRLPDVEVALANRSASVAVQSLDDRPISQSRSIVVSLGTRALPRRPGQLPFMVEPAEGTITVRAPAGLWAACKSLADGSVAPLPATYEDGRYTLRVDRRLAAGWIFLQPRQAAANFDAARSGRR